MLLDPFPKRLVDLNTLFVTIVVPSVILDLIALKFQALKIIKRKEKLELYGSWATKAKSVLRENVKLLKKVFDVFTSLSMCISDSHSSNPRLTSHETLIPNNCFVWMRKGSYG